MRSPARFGVIGLALLCSLAGLFATRLPAQVPGAYPHLVVGDGMGTQAPPPGGPFDNSGVFPALGGLTAELDLTYAALAAPNDTVFWGVLLSAVQTPFATDITPPPLFTDPPFLLFTPGAPTLDVNGEASASFLLPVGVYSGDVFLQGIVLDNSNVPRIQLSNGVNVSFQIPGFNVSYSYSLNQIAAFGELGDMRELGVVDVPPELGSDLVPLGTQPPPMPSAVDPGVNLSTFQFLPIAPNVADAPVHPLTRPFTRLEVGVNTTETTLEVEDTRGFPTRGHLLIPLATGPGLSVPDASIFDDVSGVQRPNAEYLYYDGITRTQFLNVQRKQPGTKAAPGINVNQEAGDCIVGDFTLVTTPGAHTRTRVSLDATNVDTPHVVIPAFTVDPGDGGEPITMDLDVYRFEIRATQAQGFLVQDNASHTWRVIPGTQNLPNLGTWDPVVAIAPDGRSMLAALRAGPDLNQPGGGWTDNGPDQLWAIRLDGQDWPATGEPTWLLTYELDGSFSTNQNNVRSRRIEMPATFILGAEPDDYVAYFGLAHKFKVSAFNSGFQSFNNGYEARYIREDIRVRDMVSCPLTPPGSTKAIPTFPRNYMTPQFATTGFGTAIIRFDPNVLVSDDHSMALVTGGGSETQEDVFVIRNVTIDPSGEPSEVLLNLSGHRNTLGSAGDHGAVNIRPFMPGGHGQGRRACFSADLTMAAWLAQDTSSRDWIQVAPTNASDFGFVANVFQSPPPAGDFIMPGPYETDRVVGNLQFADNDHLVFLMGRNPYNDPYAETDPANTAAMEVFVYEISTDTMTNISQTSGTQFEALGSIQPGGFFSSDDGVFSYFIREGGIGPGSLTLAEGTPVSNIVGINLATLGLFDVTGDEFGGTAIVPNILARTDVGRAPVESLVDMQFTEGTGVQQGMVYFAATEVGGNGAEQVYAFNRNAPFVNFPVTSTPQPDVHVSNIVPSPFTAKVGFARTDTDDALAAVQHPFVVDLNNFLFERDILPAWTQPGGGFLGRVMDASLHFLPASANAPDALVLAFGLFTADSFGTAQTCAPTYYPLAAASDPIVEPVAVTLPLVDTLLLGSDFRFYLHAATLYQGP